MAFRNQALPEQIRQGNSNRIENQGAPLATFSQGAAAKAKASAARWTQSDINGPADSAPPWFVGPQDFSRMRAQNPGVFKDWDDRFTNATDIGFNFRPPPPEPEPAPAPGGSPPAADSGGKG